MEPPDASTSPPASKPVQPPPPLQEPGHGLDGPVDRPWGSCTRQSFESCHKRNCFPGILRVFNGQPAQQRRISVQEVVDDPESDSTSSQRRATLVNFSAPHGAEGQAQLSPRRATTGLAAASSSSPGHSVAPRHSPCGSNPSSRHGSGDSTKLMGLHADGRESKKGSTHHLDAHHQDTFHLPKSSSADNNSSPRGSICSRVPSRQTSRMTNMRQSIQSIWKVRLTASGHVNDHDIRASVGFDEMMCEKKASLNMKEREATKRAMVILPSSKFAQYWRMVMGSAVLFTIVVCPIMLAFPWWEAPVSIEVAWILVDVVCWSDMVLNFLIAPVHHGHVEISFRERSRTYLRGWFIVDFLTNFPWVIFFSSTETASKSYKMGKFLKLPKVFRIVRLLRVFRDGAHYFGTFCSIVALVLAAHYIACLWVYTLIDCNGAIYIWQTDEVTKNSPSCPDPVHAYAEGLLAGISIVRGSASWQHFPPAAAGGGGEEPPGVAGFVWGGLPQDEILAAVLCLLCSCLLALLFGNIARSLGEQDTNTRAFHKRLENLRKAEELMGLDRTLVKRLKRHYRYFWASGLEVWRDVLQDWALSRDLYNTLALSYYGRCLAKIPFFTTCDTQLLKHLSINAKFEVFADEDFILSVGDPRKAMYFIIEGEARVATADGTVIHHLVEGSFFGEMCLLEPNSTGTLDVIANTNGKLLSITRNVVEEFCSDDLLEVFKAIAFERCNLERMMSARYESEECCASPPQSSHHHREREWEHQSQPWERKMARINTGTSNDSAPSSPLLRSYAFERRCTDRLEAFDRQLDNLTSMVGDIKSMLLAQPDRPRPAHDDKQTSPRECFRWSATSFTSVGDEHAAQDV